MSIGDDRIFTQVRSGSAIGPDIQPVFVGHCPAPANPAAVFEDARLQAQLEQMGYSERVASWREGVEDALTLLPLPVRSLAQFQRLFPAVRFDDAPEFVNQHHWLAWAIRDFFAAGFGRPDDRLCWVIRVDEAAGIDAFDINPQAQPYLAETWQAIELACTIDSAGLLVMPDFERLLVPYADKDIRRKRLPNPLPAFTPCSADLDDDHRERRYRTEMPNYTEDEEAPERLLRIAQRLHSWRPDMQWLCSLAANIEHGIATPRPAPLIESWLASTAKNEPALAQVQFLFPLIYKDTRPLGSASGLLAGHIVDKTRREGVWRSIAGTPLGQGFSSWPVVNKKHRVQLRENLGLGVLFHHRDSLQLDDERLVVKGFCDQAGTACQSGELIRFIGWLRRALRDLGEDMIFQLDGRDPVVGNMLDAFFRELYEKGALRGAQSEEAYRLTNLSTQANMINYQIELAPSIPVDRFVVTFMHDRAANGTGIQLEALAHG